jgi:hypothetical protein
MVNQQEERQRRSEPKDTVWLFQPKLRVRGSSSVPIFVQCKGAKADLSLQGGTVLTKIDCFPVRLSSTLDNAAQRE